MLLLTMNHLISDGWSMKVLIGDTWSLYQAFATGSTSTLAELPIQFADYAYWQRQLLDGPDGERMIAYWRKQLAGMGLRPPVHLPNERDVTSFDRRAENQVMTIPPGLVEAIKELGRQEGATLYIVMLASVVVLLHLHTGLVDIGVRSPIAGRDRPETTGLIGGLTNLIVLRTRFFPEATFSEILQRVRDTVIEAYDYQDLPFMKLYEYELSPPGNIHPSVTFNYVQESEQVTQNVELEEKFSQLPSLIITVVSIPDVQGSIVSAPGMLMNMVESGGALEVRVTYELARYEAAVIEQFLANYRIMIEEIIHQPNRPLSTFTLSIGDNRSSISTPGKQDL